MPSHTRAQLLALQPREQPYEVQVDTGLKLRITPAGARSWRVVYHVDGRVRAVTLPQRFPELSIRDAAAQSARIRAEARGGVDAPAAARAEKRAGVTVAEAVRDYVASKRRAKDGLGLADATKAGYLRLLDRELKPLSERPLNKLTAEEIRNAYERVRGERRRSYFVQVLRATSRWHGVRLAPFDAATPGRDRLQVRPAAVGQAKPIPLEVLGAWWRAASSRDTPGTRALRVMLLTGMRPGEVVGLRVADFDTERSVITLTHTKNRQPHRILLGLVGASICLHASLGANAKRRPGHESLFQVAELHKPMKAVCDSVGVSGPPRMLRATFASIAQAIVSYATVKRLVNHVGGNDVTLGHYIGIGDAEMRRAWQAVEDFILSASRGEVQHRDRPPQASVALS